MRSSRLAIAAFAAAAAARAEAPGWEAPLSASSAREVRAARRTGEISIDGHIDEAAWRAAQVGGDFVQSEPDDGKPATTATRFRVLWDDSSIYVAIECDDPEPPVALGGPRDRDIDADLVRIDFDTMLDRRTAYHFGVYAAGQQVDGMHFNDTDYTSDWDAAWESAVAERPGGWSVEMRIPLRALRIPQGARAFGINVARTLTRRHEESAWQYQPREFAGGVSGFGVLSGLEGIHPVEPLDVKPYFAGRSNCSTQNAAPGASGAPCQSGFDVGLDARYGLSSDLALVATVNPDFGQVELDERVLNLTTFETYLPEKRPFFLEGLDLFNLPLPGAYQIFYSRRIGESTGVPSVGAGEALVATPGARTIAGAAKLSGNSGPWSVEALTAFEPRSWGRVLGADGQVQSRVADEAAQATAVRIRRPLSEGTLAGFAVTSLDPYDASGRHSLAAAADAIATDSARDWNAAVQVAGSLLAGGTSTVLLDGTALGAGSTGWAASTRLAKDGGALNASLSADALSPQFWVNDLGFMDRGNLLRLRPSVTLRDLHPGSRWQRASVRLSADEERSFEGALLARELSVDSAITFNSYWGLATTATLSMPCVDDRELGDGTALERRGAFGLTAQVETDSTRPLRATLSAGQQFSQAFLERKTSVAVALKYRPWPALETGFSVTYENDGGTIRRVRGATGIPELDQDPTSYLDPQTARSLPRLYLLAPQYVQSVNTVLRATAAITPRVSLQAFAQLFTEGIAYGDLLRAAVAPGGGYLRLSSLSRATAADQPGDYDGREADLSLNLVLRWEWRMGSNIYLAYAHQTAGSLTSTDHRLSLFGETGALGAPGGRRGDAVLLKIDVLAGL